MKRSPFLFITILAALFFLLPAAALAADNPSVSIISPASLAQNYANQLDVKVTGLNTNFQMGQSTVAILNAQGTVVDFSGPVKEVIDQTNLIFSLNSGLAAGSYQVRVTTGNEVALGGSLTIRGVPSISLSPTQLAVGYQNTEISVYGVNTGFSDKTTVSIVNQAGISQGVGGTPRVANGGLLTVSVAPGLAEGNYKLIVRTENEEAEAGFTVASPSAVLRYNGNVFTGMPTGYLSDYELIMKGSNTGFTGTTEVRLLAGSANGTDKSEFLSNVAATGKETISLTVKKNLAPGQYYLTATTDGLKVTTSFTVYAPQISGIDFITDLAQGSILSEGYRKTKVEIHGFNTVFNISTSVQVNGKTDNISGLIIHNTTKLSFDLLPGLAAGNYQISVDLDGNTQTTGDQINRSFIISQPSIVKLNGKVIIGSLEPASIIVTGSQTHFTKGSPKVSVEGAAGAQIISVGVIDDTNLVFRILPNSVSASGTYNISVETVGLEISELARGNELLVVENSGINISPGIIYLDELVSKNITIKGTGTNFQADSEVTVGGTKVTSSVKSATEITFSSPPDLTSGVHSVTVKSGDKNYQTSVEVVARTISLSVISKNFGYDPFTVFVTGNGVTFDSGTNKPTVSISGIGSVAINNADITANKFAFRMPSGLSVGTHQVSVSFAQGSYAQIGALKAEFVVNPLNSLVFKMNQVVVSELTVIEGENDLVLTAEGQQAAGNYVNYSSEAALSVVSGSDVISYTKINNTLKISIVKAGTAKISASYGGKQVVIDIKVIGKATPAGTGNTGGTTGNPAGSTTANPWPGGAATSTNPNNSGTTGTPSTGTPSTGNAPTGSSSTGSTPTGSTNSGTSGSTGSNQGSSQTGFSDTAAHWAKKNIDRLVASGAVRGYIDGSFKPDATITRAEFATMLAKALGLGIEGTYQLSFKDTASIQIWARPAVAAVVRAGIVGGYADGTFRANNQITRAEIAVMAAKALQLKGLPGTNLSFADNSSIPSWARDPVLAAVQNGIISGYGDKTFRAKNSATRAESVTMIVRMQDFLNSVRR